MSCSNSLFEGTVEPVPLMDGEMYPVTFFVHQSKSDFRLVGVGAVREDRVASCDPKCWFAYPSHYQITHSRVRLAIEDKNGAARGRNVLFVACRMFNFDIFPLVIEGCDFDYDRVCRCESNVMYPEDQFPPRCGECERLRIVDDHVWAQAFGLGRGGIGRTPCCVRSPDLKAQDDGEYHGCNDRRDDPDEFDWRNFHYQHEPSLSGREFGRSQSSVESDLDAQG